MNSMLLNLTLVLLSILWTYFLWTRREFYKLILKFPGPLGYPLIGIGHKLLSREGLLELFASDFKAYGTTYLTWLGPSPMLLVSDPQVTQDILSSPHCVNKSYVYQAIDDAVGPTLFTQDDPHWSANSKLFKPAFSHKILLSYIPIFNSEMGILLKEFDAMVDGREKDISGCLLKSMLSIATQTTMGTCVKEEPSFRDNSYMMKYQWLQEYVADCIMAPWLIIQKIRLLLGKEKPYIEAKAQIREFIKRILERRLSGHIHDESGNDKNTFLSLAIEQLKAGHFSNKNVEDEANMVVFAAFETSSKTLANTLMLLAMFPQYQERAFEELKSIFPETGDFSVSYEDTQKMVYSELILNECMRVIAPVPLVGRQTSKAMRLSNGVWLPEGVQIILDIFHMQRSKEIWGPDAETFNPEHFLPHNFQEKHSYAFIPFTKGIRSCKGWRYGLLTMKMALAKLLRNYRFSTSFKFEDLQYIENVTTKLATTPLLKVEKRV